MGIYRGKWKKIGKTIDQVWINSLVYDEQDKRLLAFTTHRNKQKTHETWVWNYEKWEKLDIENPSARLSSSSMVWDHTRGKAVLLLKKKSKNKWGIWELEKEGWKLVWGYDYLGGIPRYYDFRFQP